MKTAKRVHLGSSESEYYLFIDGQYYGFWGCYHDGPLPMEWEVIVGEHELCNDYGI